MKKITESEIKNKLGNLPYSFEIFESIDSTSSYAKRTIDGNSHNRVVIANMQTKGRGRMGRSFHSPDSNGIYMSVVLKVDKAYEELELFTVAVAALTLRAIGRVSNEKCSIKWVNDIFLNGKKICGILCENILSNSKKYVEYVIVGIGINTGSTDNFPEELKSVAGILPGISDKNLLIAEILKEIYELSSGYNFEKYLELYRANSMVIGKNIAFLKDGAECTAKALDINGKGNLEVKLKDGSLLTLKSGEIRISAENIW